MRVKKGLGVRMFDGIFCSFVLCLFDVFLAGGNRGEMNFSFYKCSGNLKGFHYYLSAIAIREY